MKLGNSFKSNNFKRGGYSFAMTAVVIAIAIVVNLFVRALPEKYTNIDMSATQIFSIGEVTEEVLAGLEKQVTVYIVAESGTVEDRIDRFVNIYGSESDKITVSYMDPVLHPSFVKDNGLTANSVYVVCEETGKSRSIAFDDILIYDEYTYYYQGQYYYTDFDGEGLLTSAISYVTSEEGKTVYVTEGHGESALSSSASDMLAKSNWDIASVNLLMDGGIPEDCKQLFINAPTSDFADDELEMIQEYLQKGGNVVLVLGYSSNDRKNIKALMEEYGLSLENGYVADTKVYYNDYYQIFAQIDTSTEIGSNLGADSMILLRQATGMTETEPARDSITVEAFMKTSEGGLLVSENDSVEGTYILGASAKELISEKEDGEDSDSEEDTDSDAVYSALTVITADQMCSDSIVQRYTNINNLDVLVEAVNYNSEMENVSIPIKSLDVPSNTITDGLVWSILYIAVIPVGALIIGFVIWLRRRKA